MADKKRIVIHVEGGAVHEVWGIPDDVIVEIHDYDVDGIDSSIENVQTDHNGDEYVLVEWEN